MKSVVTTIVAIVAGVLLALLLLIAIEAFSAVVHPFPEGFHHTPEEMCRHVERYPPWVLAVVVPMWGATAFLSVLVTRILGNLVSLAIVGALLLAAVVGNVAMLPYPSWFVIASPLAVVFAVAMAGRQAFARRSGIEGNSRVATDPAPREA